jgi:ML domain
LELADYRFKSDACKSQLSLKCPGKAGMMNSMIQEIEVDQKIEPRALDTMQFYLTDAKTQECLFCIKFPVKIIGAKQVT